MPELTKSMSQSKVVDLTNSLDSRTPRIPRVFDEYFVLEELFEDHKRPITGHTMTYTETIDIKYQRDREPIKRHQYLYSILRSYNVTVPVIQVEGVKRLLT